MAAIVAAAKHLPIEGSVSLLDKVLPTSERPDKSSLANDWAFLRSQVDVSAFQEKLRKYPPEVWDAISERDNTTLTRPAHDSWGIKKLVFVFCDDFLQKVMIGILSCPLSHL